MQYSSFIEDHIPCQFKALIEDSSLEQLHFVSDGSHVAKPEFVSEFRSKNACKAASSKVKNVMVENTGPKKQKAKEDSITKPLSLNDIFIIISREGNFTRSFRGWKICAVIHNKPILYGLPDDPKARCRRTNSLYLGSMDDYRYPQFISRSPQAMDLQSAIGGTLATTFARKSSAGSVLVGCGQTASPKSAITVKSYHGITALASPLSSGGKDPSGGAPLAGSNTRSLVSQVVRPASLSALPSSVLSALSPSEQPTATDRPLDDTVQEEDNPSVESYSSNYREGYTYRKLQEKKSSTSATSSTTSSTRCLTPPSNQATINTSSNRTTPVLSKPTVCVKGMHLGNRKIPVVVQTAAVNHRRQVIDPAPQQITVDPRRWTAARKSQKDRVQLQSSMVRPKCAGSGNKSCNKQKTLKNPTGARGMRLEPNIQLSWPIGQRFHDICDVGSTVRRHSPTEGSISCQPPDKSSPSIPSNTNGKFGGKCSDQPYPTDLHISAASCPTQAPAFDFLI